MTGTPGYCAVHGYDFSSNVYAEGVDISGGGLSVEEITTQARNYADVRKKGRTAKKYKIRARSTERSDIETFLREVNTAPEEAEFLPFDEGRAGYIASAYASLQSPKQFYGGIFYEAEAEITCREAWLYGADQGIDFQWTVPLNKISDAVTNQGHENAPIAYLQCGGDRTDNYVEDLSVRITPGTSAIEHDRELALCDKLLRGDLLELGWRGELWHSYECPMISLGSFGKDIHNLISGGSMTSGVLLLDNLDYFLIPFYGPNQISGEAGAAKLEIYVDATTGGGATIQAGTETDGSDMAAIDCDDLVVGNNIIPIPDVDGETDLCMGVKAAASGSISISAIKGSVKRYVAPSKIPYSEPDEAVKIRVETTSTGQRLRFLQATMPNRYWY